VGERRARHSRAATGRVAHLAGSHAPAAPACSGQAVVEIVLPAYNEERDLEPSVRRLRSYLDWAFPFPTLVTIADNASTDATPRVGARLAAEMHGVRFLRLEQKGRGRALRAVWSQSEAAVYTLATFWAFHNP
jgi:hypothetical protein